MRPLLLPACLLLTLVACNNSVEENRQVKSYSIEQFYKSIESYRGGLSADDADLLVSSNETGIFNVYKINLETGNREQLTHSTQESYFARGFVPGTRHFLYSADNGGNELTHIYLQREDGSVSDLTPGDQVKANYWGWNREGSLFYFTSNKRDPRFFDIYKMDTVNWEAKMIYKNESGLEPNEISPNERYVTLTEFKNTSWVNQVLYDLQTGKKTYLNTDSIASSNTAMGFTNDSKYAYFISDEGSEFSYAAKYEIETGKTEKVYEDKWDVTSITVSHDEKYRLVSVNEDGFTRIHFFDNASGKELEVPEIKGGSINSAGISRSGKKMVMHVGSSRSPVNIYIYDIETKDLKQLSNALNPEIDVEDLVNAEVVRYKSFDGLEIPAIYYKPHQATSANKVPAIVMVHGGPGGQATPNYFPLVQFLVNKGYAILDVNNRGSSGYGKTFYKMDDRDHGNNDLKDVVWGKKYLAGLPHIDSSKIAIMGGSYGGFMTLAALCFYPDEFKAGVDIFGVTNWMRTLREVPAHWESFKAAIYAEMGDPYTEDSTRLLSFSPLLNADKISKPLMVLQGANDPRVLQVESDEIVAAVKKNNVPVDYVLFPDEGHGFMKKENEIKGYGKIGEFLDKYLK